MPATNRGSIALPNGVYGDRNTPRADNVLPPSLQTSFKIPTNGKPSPLFGAQPYTQQLLLFEEFGTEKLDPTLPAPPLTFPVPTVGPAPAQDPNFVARSGPSPAALEAFMRQPGLYPFPSQFSNVLDRNPWKAQIEAFLNRQPVGSPAEGRPPGKGWAHQRWNEFYPQAYFKTVQAGAKLNGGMRDRRQLHNYAVGEFGPGGLYYNTSDNPTSSTGTTKGIDRRSTRTCRCRITSRCGPSTAPSAQAADGALWPAGTDAALQRPADRSGGQPRLRPAHHQHPRAQRPLPGRKRRLTNAFFFPGQFYDYRWPMQLAGYDTINTTATDPRAAFPCAPGEKLWVNDATPGLKTARTAASRSAATGAKR
jgi:hypothetical protein